MRTLNLICALEGRAYFSRCPLDFSLDDVLQHLLVQAEVGNPALQPDILLLKLRELSFFTAEAPKPPPSH